MRFLLSLSCIKKYNLGSLVTLRLFPLACLGLLCSCQSHGIFQSTGVTQNTIRLGSVLVLQGQDEALGNGMRLGMEASLAGEKVQGRSLEIIFKNDYYEPASARKATEELLEEHDIFLALGNVGTPTAHVTLPILAEHHIPAVGFFTGARLLRENATGAIVNYRAGYGQEIAAVVEMALQAGITPAEVCAYVQNDGYGLDALNNLKQTLTQAEASADIIERYDQILASKGDRNNLGPVGVYTRNTPYSEPGYNSLKKWESESGVRCKLVITAATYRNLTYFTKMSREKGETWLISALSFTGADELRWDLEEYNLIDGIIMTQVVPLLDSDLPIVKEARNALGKKNFGLISLEGYVVGKMLLQILRDIPRELTRENFLKQVSESQFNLGGIPIDFTEGDNQGSDLVIVSRLTQDGFKEIELSDLALMLK
ncbi:MAG: ABC transporter substrate-binding protein [Xenococcus sp. MO_188.B8]|nr:ABC transporter substrate-binding protein [Xenococcus sp. MO_188.B8]